MRLGAASDFPPNLRRSLQFFLSSAKSKRIQPAPDGITSNSALLAENLIVTSPTQSNPNPARLLLPIQPDDHAIGATDAPYTLVEYGDYECPDCGSLFLAIRDLQATFGNALRLVFRHYPLLGIHHRAQQAAEAAEAAGAQGRFWEMHSLLFENQGLLDTKSLYKHAAKLSLDGERFRRELSQRIYEPRVREDFRRGVVNGVYGTPGLFINGVRHNGALDTNSLLAQLEAKMKA